VWLLLGFQHNFFAVGSVAKFVQNYVAMVWN
jgi:hypothetical protein